MPASFLDVINYRKYLDKVNEAISLYSQVSEPPSYIVHTPLLFSRWQDWASNQQMKSSDKSNEIRPLGEKIYPSWIQNEFKGLENFYQDYTMLVEETKEIQDAS